MDITQSTVYKETTSASEPELDIPVEKQQTYLVFESAFLCCVQKDLHFC